MLKIWTQCFIIVHYRYFKSKLENFGISLIYIAISFAIQLLGELMDKIADNNIKILFVVNIIVIPNFSKQYLLGLELY